MVTMVMCTILLCVAEIVGFVAFAWLIRMYADRKQAEIERRIDTVIHAWGDPQGEAHDQPSKLAQLLDALGAVVGLAAARSIMGALSTQDGHLARQANNLADQVVAQQNPLLGLLSGGRKGKGAALRHLAEVLGPMLMGSGGNHKSGPSDERPTDLKRFDKF
jgi:hypothetical protein